MIFRNTIPKYQVMVYFKRLLETKLKTLFSLFPVVCIQGARQVGKSTLVEKTFGGKIPTVTFDPVTDIDDARKDPDFFLQTHPSPVFLDEIQYAPELLSSLKRKVDREKKAGMYIISGSQNLGILKNISESLAGRVIILDLHTMSQRELNENTENKSVIYHYLFEENINLQNIMKINFPDLKRNLWRGFFPGLIDKPDDAVPYFYDSYLRTYIERDIRVLANLDSMQEFGNFFGILAGLSSTEINPSEIGRELGIDRKTAKRWMMLAEQSFQWITVPSFSRNPVKKVSQKSKGYFTDTGMICSLQKISSPESVLSHPMKGRLFETYIVMEILKTVQEFPVRPNLYHFRSHSGAELDLILEIDGKLFPIEIKMKSNPSKDDAKNFSSFRTMFPNENISKGMIISSAESPRWITEDVFTVPYWLI